jgi:hypothetical protein
MKPLIVVAALVALAGCNSLPSELRRDIKNAASQLEKTRSEFGKSSDEIQADLAHSPDLFNAIPATAQWRSRLATANSRLEAAETDRRELERLDKSGRKEDVPRIRQLLADEERLQTAARAEAEKIQADATHYLDFQRNLPHYLAKLKDAHDATRTADLTAVSAKVEKAARDWPNKRADLESRLQALKTAPDRADRVWQATEAERHAAADGKATGPQVATLIRADEEIETAAHLPEEAADLSARSDQLYNAWDRILEDLDAEGGRYRERVKTVKTHFAEANDAAPRTSSDERWIDTTPAQYQAVENDLGMAISHKDAGLYDSEAVNTAQPAGFAYIAPPSVGRNQYGYWSHDDRGNSFWTFLPQYLIMRELFWGRNYYQPIVINEYNGYYNAYRSGRTYYGQSSPTAPPRYGTQGTYTQQRYSNSRYVQSGGFKNSAYANHPAPAAAPAERRYGSSPAAAPSDNSQGKRFGHPAEPGAAPSGKRFGSPSGGNRPMPSGKRFGGGSRRR